MTYDVCDRCWGSGDSSHPWFDIRKAEALQQEQIEVRAQRLLERSMGAGIGILQGAQGEIAEALDRLANKRKLQFQETINLASVLAKRLRAMAAAGRDWNSE